MIFKISRISRFLKNKSFTQVSSRILSTQPIPSVIELHNNKYESDDYYNLTPKILSYLDKVSEQKKIHYQEYKVQSFNFFL